MSLVKPHFVPGTEDELHATLLRVARARIFFAHQSIGADILKGINELSIEYSTPIEILEIEDTIPGHDTVLAHARIGRNGDPSSKLTHFAQLLEGGIGRSVEIAVLKLCYVDVTRQTDSVALGDDYLRQAGHLATCYPHLKIVHCTVPLAAHRRGFKATLARSLGRPDLVMADNRARTLFNDHLRNHCGRSVTLFDLAQVETGQSPHAVADAGTENNTPSLHPAFTSDGGHLNRNGRKIVAEAFVRTLGRILL